MWDGWVLGGVYECVCVYICVYVFPRGTSNAVERDLTAGNAFISLGSGQLIKLFNISTLVTAVSYIRTERLPPRKWELRL